MDHPRDPCRGHREGDHAGDDPGGIIVTMLIGIAGAIIGGLIASALEAGEIGDFFDIGTWIIAIRGSLLLLAAYRAATARRRT
jgi:uncharacterized membrane protein YeaQ/YmgE (transglycosylase-associated protein family)